MDVTDNDSDVSKTSDESIGNTLESLVSEIVDYRESLCKLVIVSESSFEDKGIYYDGSKTVMKHVVRKTECSDISIKSDTIPDSVSVDSKVKVSDLSIRAFQPRNSINTSKKTISEGNFEDEEIYYDTSKKTMIQNRRQSQDSKDPEKTPNSSKIIAFADNFEYWNSDFKFSDNDEESCHSDLMLTDSDNESKSGRSNVQKQFQNLINSNDKLQELSQKEVIASETFSEKEPTSNNDLEPSINLPEAKGSEVTIDSTIAEDQCERHESSRQARRSEDPNAAEFRNVNEEVVTAETFSNMELTSGNDVGTSGSSHERKGNATSVDCNKIKDACDQLDALVCSKITFPEFPDRGQEVNTEGLSNKEPTSDYGQETSNSSRDTKGNKADALSELDLLRSVDCSKESAISGKSSDVDHFNSKLSQINQESKISRQSQEIIKALTELEKQMNTNSGFQGMIQQQDTTVEAGSEMKPIGGNEQTPMSVGSHGTIENHMSSNLENNNLSTEGKVLFSSVIDAVITRCVLNSDPIPAAGILNPVERSRNTSADCVETQDDDADALDYIFERIIKCHPIKKFEIPPYESAVVVGTFGSSKDTCIDGKTEDAGIDGKTEDAGIDGKTEDAGIDGKTEDAGIDGKTEDTGIDGKTEDTGIDGKTEDTGIDGSTEDAGIDVHPNILETISEIDSHSVMVYDVTDSFSENSSKICDGLIREYIDISTKVNLLLMKRIKDISEEECELRLRNLLSLDDELGYINAKLIKKMNDWVKQLRGIEENIEQSLIGSRGLYHMGILIICLQLVCILINSTNEQQLNLENYENALIHERKRNG